MTENDLTLPRVKLSNGETNMSVVMDVGGQVKEKMSAKDVVDRARAAFDSGKTKSYDFRIKQLRNLLRFIRENEKALCHAMWQDIRKPEQEALLTEVDYVAMDVEYYLKNLKSLMKPERPKATMMNFFDKVYIVNDPYGVCLIMGAWNYPVNLTLSPLVGAIAAGNCVVIKPSDLCPATSTFLCNNLNNYLDPECYPVYLGGVPETTQLLEQRFDYIFFTGSTMVGRIVYNAAVKNLTPVTLELGGKSPCFIDNTADIEIATRRILWGKFSNCGQTCVAPDYILCNKVVEQKFVQLAEKLLTEYYGRNAKLSKDYGRIVNERHFVRVTNLMKDQKIAVGGNVDAKDLYIHPTILVDVSPNDDVMQEEIFGPVLPIINVDDADQAIKFINEREKPLALYIFSNDKKTKRKFLENTSSGGVCINDTIMHLSVESLPFGGVGESGMGSYHGKKTFETFTHKKGVLERNFNHLAEKLQSARYPPYSKSDTQMLRNMVRATNVKVNFKWISYVFVFALGVGATFAGCYLRKYVTENKE